LAEFLFEEDYRIAVKKGNTELLNSINATLQTIQNNGKLNKIIEKHTKKSGFFGSSFFEQVYNNLIYKERYMMIIDGLYTTLLISAVVLFIGILIGSVIAFIKFSSNTTPIVKIFQFLANLYLTIIRGTPVLVQLFIIYYLVLAKTGLSKTVVAIIAFGINSGAYVAEIIRSGLLSVDHGQFESGRSLGLSNKTTMIKIILPQALKNVVATLCNEFITLIKETSIVSFIGLVDLARAGDIIRSQTYEPLVPLLSVALIYLAIIWLITLLMSVFERRLRRSDNR
jgi:His/Glu/Gln/Arg/opine family amino acid ABC transporter permease subunit